MKFLLEILRMIFSVPAAGKQIPGASITLKIGSGYDRDAEEQRKRAAVVAFMRSQIGKPYKLGIEIKPGQEADAEAWDCSEEVEAAFRVAGMFIPDGSPMQFDYCRPIRAPLAADLGFLWSDKWARIGHVWVATGEGTIVHAMAGRGVVEDTICNLGTIIKDFLRRFRGWRRHPDFSWPQEDRA